MSGGLPPAAEIQTERYAGGSRSVLPRSVANSVARVRAAFLHGLSHGRKQRLYPYPLPAFTLCPFSGITRECKTNARYRPLPSLPNGSDYRRPARQIRDLTRQTQLPVARSELLRLATN